MYSSFDFVLMLTLFLRYGQKKGWKRCWLGHPPDVATSFRTTPTQPPLDASVGSDLPFGGHAFA
jgi:hypothetical protein